MDSKTGMFEAYAAEPLIIENKELGYRLTYLLEDYKVYMKQGFSSFYGFSAFEELESKTKRKKRQYEKERDKAYFGSMPHFFRVLYNGTLVKAGYEIYHAQDMQGMGRMIDPNQVALNTIVSQELDGQIKKLEFQNFLYVYYKGEKESADFIANTMGTLTIKRAGGASGKSQNSWVQMRDEIKFIEFEENGYVRNPMDFFSFGYWAYEKIGDMMPINYLPVNLRDKK